MAGNAGMIIIGISGTSGTGKTTIGRLIAQRMGWTFIDQDRFFIRKKPKVELTTGEIVDNWDSLDAIDWDALNRSVISAAQNGPVVLVGFCLVKSRLDFEFTKHIHLKYDAGFELEMCVAARRKSKPGMNAVRDAVMVEEVVLPFQKEVEQQLGNLEVVVVSDVLNRKSIPDLVGECLKIIRP